MKAKFQFPPKIVSAIRRLISRVLRKDWWKRIDNSNAFRRGMKQLGFKATYAGGCGSEVSTDRWEHLELNLVFKCSYVCGKMPKKAVPTLELRKPTRRRKYALLLQPRVDLSNKYDAYSALEPLPRYIRGRDLHAGNVGHWNGEPVVFDW